MSVITQTQIANRVCQKVGAELIAAGALLTEDSKPANEIRNCYDILRRRELRRNVWRFSIRTVALRAMDTGSKLVTFGTWLTGTTYGVFDIIVGDDGQLYYSKGPGNIGNTPSTSPKWELYFGVDAALEFITTWNSGITYMSGDRAAGSDGVVYYSLIDTNLNHNPVGDGNVHWKQVTDSSQTASAQGLSFYVGEVVRAGNNVYVSVVNNNQADISVAASWKTMTTLPTVAPPYFFYPIGSGPSSESMTKNSYRLPVGFMREAPQDPKAGGALFLGAPDGSSFNDWNYENNYFTTSDSGVITYRFAADIQDVTQFDPLFVDGFTCTMALEVCEPLTQSSAKLADIGREYKVFMGEAREVNSIEDGPTYPPEDAYITCRW